MLWLLSDGYVDVEDILELPEARNKTEQHVRNIVRNDTKGRFYLRESCGILQIKATQGHSFEVILYSIFHKLRLISILVRGTIFPFQYCTSYISLWEWYAFHVFKKLICFSITHDVHLLVYWWNTCIDRSQSLSWNLLPITQK